VPVERRVSQLRAQHFLSSSYSSPGVPPPGGERQRKKRDEPPL